VADRAAAATVGAKALCHSVHAIRARHTIYLTATRERTPTAILPMARSSPYPVFRPN